MSADKKKMEIKLPVKLTASCKGGEDEILVCCLLVNTGFINGMFFMVSLFKNHEALKKKSLSLAEADHPVKTV